MEPNDTNEPVCYNSSFRHGVDDKRRVQIPALWRPASPGTQLTLVSYPASKEVGRCLRVLSLKQMLKVMEEIEAIPNREPRKVHLRRTFGGESVQVVPDKAGRILIPEKMATEAGIKDEALLIGMLHFFEIWNPERYDKLKPSEEELVDTFAEFIG
jgi:transcriptional regulator MraZ